MGEVVLALDPGTNCGWAIAGEGQPKPRAGTITMPDVERDVGLWSKEFVAWMLPFARMNNVTQVVAEGPIIAMHHGPDGTSVNMNAAETLIGIFTMAAYATAELGLPKMVKASRSTVCAHFIAVGGGPNYRRSYLKPATIAACQRKNWNVTSEDAADALAALDWFCFDRKIAVGWDCSPMGVPLFEQQGVRMDKSNTAAAKRLMSSALSFDRAKNGG